MSAPLIDEQLVRRLLRSQFPQWSALPLLPVDRAGWDNQSFRLGEHLLVRLPTAEEYAAQTEKEHLWLPRLAPSLPLEIPAPVGLGKPANGYPWRWAIYQWIDGDAAEPERVTDLTDFARILAQFLIALERVDATEGPRPGRHNFYRGGSLRIYDAETRQAIGILKSKIDTPSATEVWETALTTNWDRPPVWVHGDVSAGNLVVRGGQLSAVIDFGMLGVGDPACDLSIAWTLFSGESRETFRAMLACDPGTWARGRGWALWKALIVAADLTNTNALEAAQCWDVISGAGGA